MPSEQEIEAAARAICERRGQNPDWPIGVDRLGHAQEPYVREVPSWKWFCEGIAKAALEAAERVRKEQKW